MGQLSYFTCQKGRFLNKNFFFVIESFTLILLFVTNHTNTTTPPPRLPKDKFGILHPPFPPTPAVVSEICDATDNSDGNYYGRYLFRGIRECFCVKRRI